MGKSLTRKILEAHLVGGSLRPGEECVVNVDQVLMQDATGTTAAMEFELCAPNASVSKDIFAIVYVDHNVLGVGPRNANDWKFLQTFCAKRGIWYSSPMNGICHQLHTERFARPGIIQIGSDSHTPTTGCVGCVALGAGGMDAAVVLAGKPFEMSAPQVVGVRLGGKLQNWASGKDVILELLRRLTVAGGINKVFEFFGPGAKTLAVTDRAPISNMITELGATSAVFPADERVREFLRMMRREKDFTPLLPDDDAEYDEIIDLDLSSIEPLVACPSSPDNVVPVREVAGLEIGQACFGSSANSWFPDLWFPAYIFKHALLEKSKTVLPHVRVTVNPGSRNIELTAEREGVLRILREAASAKINWPVCGPCVGMGDSPSEDVRSIRTFNRNFPGRSGTPNDQVYLASPAIVAACAVTGVITDPRDIGIGGPPNVPVPHYVIDDRFIFPPLPQRERKKIQVFVSSTIKPPPLKGPLANDLTGQVLIVLGDNVATGTISPDGARWMGMRSDFEAIAQGAFITLDTDFTQEKQVSEFAARAKAAGGGFIAGGKNYGQGSSREHAAQSPMVLGVTAVFAKFFARIHKRNLINHGIVPILISDALHAHITQGDTWYIFGVRDAVAGGGKVFDIRTPHGVFPGELDLSPRERALLLSGGLLNYVRSTRKKKK